MKYIRKRLSIVSDQPTQPTDHDTALTNAALGFAEAISDADKEARAADAPATDADPYPNAGRDSGYVAPVGEDLVNRLTVLISGIETKVLISHGKLAAEIDANARTLNNMRQADLDRRVAANELEDRHRERLYSELDTLHDGQASIKAVVESTATDLGKLSAQVGDQGTSLAALIGIVSTQGEVVNQHGMTLEEHGARIARQEAELVVFAARLVKAEAEQARQAVTQARQAIVQTEQAAVLAGVRTQMNTIVAHLQRDKEFLRRLREDQSGAE